MALACSWGGYADTDLDFAEFFAGDHTVAVRFMLQYPNAYSGPLLAVNGTGTYFIGQGDFLADSPGGQQKLVVQIGNVKQTYAANLGPGVWHHLAVVRSGNTFTVYLDGKQTGGTLTPGSLFPSGKLRFGKDTFDAALDGGGRQFYGLLDDAAFFKIALTEAGISALAGARHLTGKEEGLHAGYTFGHVPPGGLTPKLSRRLTRTPAAFLAPVSANLDNAADAKLLPLSLTSFMHLPFPVGQEWQVIQGFDTASGSHKGYASFSWDLILAGKPQSESNLAPFSAAAPGVVNAVKEDSDSSAAANLVTIKQADHEYCDYLHLALNSATVNKGDSVSEGRGLAKVGDTGANEGAYHLHLAVTNLGEANKGNGGAFVTIPAPIANYEASDDSGRTWQHVLRGVPRAGQWIRRKAVDSPVRYTAVWRPSNEGETHVYGWKYEDFRKKYDELWKQGWRLKLLKVYVVNGEVRYTAAWHPSNEGETQVYGWKYEDFRKKYDELWKQGWRLKLLSVYVVGGNVFYTAVWRPSTEAETQVYGWKYEDFRKKYDELWKQSWRLKLLSVYVVNGQTLYTAAWRPGEGHEAQVYGWVYEDYRANYDVLWHQGWRLEMLQPYVL